MAEYTLVSMVHKAVCIKDYVLGCKTSLMNVKGLKPQKVHSLIINHSVMRLEITYRRQKKFEAYRCMEIKQHTPK